jgi:hypothetical protein
MYDARRLQATVSAVIPNADILHFQRLPTQKWAPATTFPVAPWMTEPVDG